MEWKWTRIIHLFVWSLFSNFWPMRNVKPSSFTSFKAAFAVISPLPCIFGNYHFRRFLLHSPSKTEPVLNKFQFVRSEVAGLHDFFRVWCSVTNTSHSSFGSNSSTIRAVEPQMHLYQNLMHGKWTTQKIIYHL